MSLDSPALRQTQSDAVQQDPFSALAVATSYFKTSHDLTMISYPDGPLANSWPLSGCVTATNPGHTTTWLLWMLCSGGHPDEHHLTTG